MINLLPNEIKQSYRFARYNVSLVRWVISTALCFFVIGLIGSYGWLTMRQNISTTNDEITTTTERLQAAQLDQTNKRVIVVRQA